MYGHKTYQIIGINIINAKLEVMVNDWNLILGQDNIKLDHISATHKSLIEGLNRVLNEVDLIQSAVKSLAHATVSNRQATAAIIISKVLLKAVTVLQDITRIIVLLDRCYHTDLSCHETNSINIPIGRIKCLVNEKL